MDEKQIAQFVSKNLPGAKKTYSGIWYTLEYQGEGAFAQVDDIVALRYTARFLDGKTFGSSDTEGELYEFPVGHGLSLLALDEIMLLLREGAKGTFVIPSYLAYGQDGRQGLVPPDTPILLEIEFMDTVVKKIIIENKGKILQEEEAKAKEKGMTREEYFEYIQKEIEKRKIKGVKFGEDG
ncbi:MAG: hypothetical protein HC913_20800 [Microscillaceae bacterium]|nr:hypothetical protein [Microscillaceae bacterium]